MEDKTIAGRVYQATVQSTSKHSLQYKFPAVASLGVTCPHALGTDVTSAKLDMLDRSVS